MSNLTVKAREPLTWEQLNAIVYNQQWFKKELKDKGLVYLGSMAEALDMLIAEVLRSWYEAQRLRASVAELAEEKLKTDFEKATLHTHPSLTFAGGVGDQSAGNA